MQKTIVEKNLASCKIPYTIIRPKVSRHSILNFNDLEYLIRKGELEAKKHVRKIKRDIARLEQINKIKKNIAELEKGRTKSL